MNGPLNSLKSSGKTGASAAAADLAAKLSSGKQATGADPATMQTDFSRWMAKAAATTPQSQATAAQLSANAKASTGQGGNGSVEARNALARAQANAAQQAKHQTPTVKPDTAQAPKADQPKAQDQTQAADSQQPANAQAKADATKGKPQDSSDKASAQDQAGDDTATDDAKVADASTEASAKDAASTDAPTATDPSAMLAWLAHLTHGAAAAKSASLGGDAKKATADATALTGKEGTLPAASAATGHDALAAIAAASDKGAAGAIDVSKLQATEGRLAVLEGADATAGAAKGADFANTLSTEMLRGLAGKAGETQAAAAPQSSTLSTPVNSPEFPQALADHVGMWVNAAGEDGSMSAELHLNPAEMGPISVKISLDGQSAQVDFAAANLETRRAIEASLPMLSASLDDAGFSLGGSGVSDQTPQQQFNQASGQPGGAPAWGGGSSGRDASIDEQPQGRMARAVQAGQRGGLDLYA